MFFFLAKISIAQTDSIPLYERYGAVPPFTITKVPDSSSFANTDLNKKQSVIIMEFSPDCEHCQRETDSLIAHIDLFKDVQIVMASPLNFENILKFYKDYKIADYPNITMGRDGAYALGSFYKIRNFPSIFVYDKEGHFKKAFSGSYPIQKIAAAL
ncbi:MAG: redoxin domain-containing protein [Ferruginibacter sp.]